MKKCFLPALILFSTTFVNHIFASMEPGSKIYVSKKSITIENKKIFIKTKTGHRAVKAIHSDKKGFFILKSEFVRAKRMYRCPWPRCGYVTNNQDDLECHLWAAHRGWKPGER